MIEGSNSADTKHSINRLHCGREKLIGKKNICKRHARLVPSGLPLRQLPQPRHPTRIAILLCIINVPEVLHLMQHLPDTLLDGTSV